MKCLVLIILTLASLVEAGILDSLPYSPYGGFRYPNSYESTLKYNRDRYYAKKAKALAELRSAIYGIGDGFYGFRYRYRPFFPKMFNNIQIPFFDGSPATYFGALSIPFIQPSIISNIFWKYPLGLPSKNYENSYSSKWVYGKDYSQSNNYFYSKPVSYGYSKILNSKGQVALPAKHFQPSPVLIPPISPVYTPGYQASLFLREQPPSKSISTPTSFKEYDSIYGSKYSSSFKNDQQPQQWKDPILGKEFFNPGSYNFPYDFKSSDIPSSNPIKGIVFPKWNDDLKQVKTLADLIPFGGYNSIYGLRYNKSPAFAPNKFSNLPQAFSKSVNSENPLMEYNSDYGSKYTNPLVGKGTGGLWSGSVSKEILNSPGTYSLLPPAGKDFSMISGAYGSYINDNNEFSSKYSSTLLNNDHDASPSEKILHKESANSSDVQLLDMKSSQISLNVTDAKLTPDET